MSKARGIMNEKGSNVASWRSWLNKTSTALFHSTLSWGSWAYSHSRTIAWWVVTTGMITALPLVFEIKREMFVEELEQMQINTAAAEGKTPQELSQLGLQSAIEPKVLKG